MCPPPKVKSFPNSHTTPPCVQTSLKTKGRYPIRHLTTVIDLWRGWIDMVVAEKMIIAVVLQAAGVMIDK